MELEFSKDGKGAMSLKFKLSLVAFAALLSTLLKFFL